MVYFRPSLLLAQNCKYMLSTPRMCPSLQHRRSKQRTGSGGKKNNIYLPSSWTTCTTIMGQWKQRLYVPHIHTWSPVHLLSLDLYTGTGIGHAYQRTCLKKITNGSMHNKYQGCLPQRPHGPTVNSNPTARSRGWACFWTYVLVHRMWFNNRVKWRFHRGVARVLSVKLSRDSPPITHKRGVRPREQIRKTKQQSADNALKKVRTTDRPPCLGRKEPRYSSCGRIIRDARGTTGWVRTCSTRDHLHWRSTIYEFLLIPVYYMQTTQIPRSPAFRLHFEQ